MNQTIPTLGDRWDVAVNMLAASTSGIGSDKILAVHVRFDGNGNAIVKFVVTNHGESMDYGRHDEAVYNYNRFP